MAAICPTTTKREDHLAAMCVEPAWTVYDLPGTPTVDEVIAKRAAIARPRPPDPSIFKAKGMPYTSLSFDHGLGDYPARVTALGRPGTSRVGRRGGLRSAACRNRSPSGPSSKCASPTTGTPIAAAAEFKSCGALTSSGTASDAYCETQTAATSLVWRGRAFRERKHVFRAGPPAVPLRAVLPGRLHVAWSGFDPPERVGHCAGDVFFNRTATKRGSCRAVEDPTPTQAPPAPPAGRSLRITPSPSPSSCCSPARGRDSRSRRHPAHQQSRFSQESQEAEHMFTSSASTRGRSGAPTGSKARRGGGGFRWPAAATSGPGRLFFDTTLRDGEQSPVVSQRPENCDMAHQLSAWASRDSKGLPASSPGDSPPSRHRPGGLGRRYLRAGAL